MFEEEKLENQPQSTPQRRDGKVATDIASIFGEEKTSELPKPSDNIFITPDGKKISYNQEEVDNLRIKTTFQKLMQDTKDKIEQTPSDVEEREYGSEGVIYRVKLFIGGIEQYIIAMKLRYDNAITHEAEMLKTANNLVMLGDEYGEGEGERAKVPDLY
ncbi:MAG: hypothetical protein LBD75_02580 [Candidatus Peribacteria bacterium]|nr:hypothetical protein [Candidatus Peribacteria bacterium]